MTNEQGPSPDEFFNWETIRETPEYINSVRKVLSKRISNHEIGGEIFTQVFNLEDLRKFLEDKKLTITYDEVIYAADEDYKEYQKTGNLGSDTTLN